MSINKSCDTQFGIILQPYPVIVVSSIVFVLLQYAFDYADVVFKRLCCCSKPDEEKEDDAIEMEVMPPWLNQSDDRQERAERDEVFKTLSSAQKSFTLKHLSGRKSSPIFFALQTAWTIVSIYAIMRTHKAEGADQWTAYSDLGGKLINSCVTSQAYLMLCYFYDSFAIPTSVLAAGDAVFTYIDNVDFVKVHGRILRVIEEDSGVKYEVQVHDPNREEGKGRVETWDGLNTCNGVSLLTEGTKSAVMMVLGMVFLLLFCTPWLITHILPGLVLYIWVILTCGILLVVALVSALSWSERAFGKEFTQHFVTVPAVKLFFRMTLVMILQTTYDLAYLYYSKEHHHGHYLWAITRDISLRTETDCYFRKSLDDMAGTINFFAFL
jgi:hypothetical protein